MYGMNIDAATEERYVNFVVPYRDAYYDWAKKFTVDYDLGRSPMMWHIELGKPNIDLIEKGWKHGYGERMVSGRIKRILEKYNLPKHQFTPIDVRYKGEPVEFYMFTIFENHKKYVDWENTVFYPRTDLLGKERVDEPITFKSEEDYQKNYRSYLVYTTGKYYSIVPEQLVFKKFSEEIFYILGIIKFPYKIYLREHIGKQLSKSIQNSLELGIGPYPLKQRLNITTYVNSDS